MNLPWLKLTIIYSIILTAKVETTNKSTEMITSEESRKIRRILPGEPLGGLTGCDSFVIGNEKMLEFYSPNYPLNYTNNITCIRTISAPSSNQQIVLDFRDKFSLEPSERCKYDYLEIRDGSFGYSPLLASYCGHSFPEKEITSSGPHMWLKFHSDDHIEYGGFKAVYRFIEKQNTSGAAIETEPCFVNITALESEYISNDNISQEIWNKSKISGLECMYVISVAENKKVSLQWDSFELDYPNDCVKNKIDVFDKKSDTALSCFCGATAEPVISEDHIMRVRLVADKNVSIKFKAHFTAFRSGQNCTDNEFNCQDETCIDAELHCNKMVNCRTGSDEDEEDCREEQTLWEHLTEGDIMIILVIFFATILGMCCTLLFNIVRKLIHDYRVIKENIARSRESQLDQLGRKTPTMTILTPMATIVPNFPDNIVRSDDTIASESRHSSTIFRHQSSDDCYVPTEDTFPNIVRRETYDRVNVNSNGGPAFHIIRPQQQQQQQQQSRRYRYNSNEYSKDDNDDDDDGGFAAAAVGTAGNRTNPDGIDPNFVPEMIDTECQTRESLFQNTSPFSSFINRTNSSDEPSSSLSADGVATTAAIRLSTFPRKSMPSFCSSSSSSTTINNNVNVVGSTIVSPPPPPIGFTTFGYKNRLKSPDNRQQERQHRRFKAEAIIELNDNNSRNFNNNNNNKRKSTTNDNSAPPANSENSENSENIDKQLKTYSFQSTKSAPDVIVTH